MSSQSYSGPERRHYSREAPAPPLTVGRARVLVEHARHYPALQADVWYSVLDRNRTALEPIARPGYVWLDLGGRPRHVWAAHFEVEMTVQGSVEEASP